jgi:hypothetical protein
MRYNEEETELLFIPKSCICCKTMGKYSGTGKKSAPSPQGAGHPMDV